MTNDPYELVTSPYGEGDPTTYADVPFAWCEECNGYHELLSGERLDDPIADLREIAAAS